MPSPLLSRGLRLSIAVASIAAAVVASADVKKYDFNVGLQTTDWSHNVSLARFDSALGTLTSVEIYLTGSINTDVWLSNMSDHSSNTITGHAGGEFVMTESATGFGVFDETVEKSVSQEFAVNNTHPKVATYDGLIGQKFLGVTASDTFHMGSSDANILAYVTGASPLQFEIDAYDASYTGDTAGNNEHHYSTSAAASGYIQYNYTPQAVPEPSAFAALGLGALGMLRRRNRKGGARR